MPSPPPPQEEHGAAEPHPSRPGVDLALVDACLASIADALHDRPVQQLVAAKLLIQTALPPPDGAQDGDAASAGPSSDPGLIDPALVDRALVDRAVTAVTTAGQQSRDLMWALSTPSVRPDQVAADVVDAVSRAAGPEEELRVAVDVDADTDPQAVRVAVHAAHHLLTDLLLAGGHLQSIGLRTDAESIEAVLTASTGTTDGPWVKLASARAAAAGGRVEAAIAGAVATEGTPGWTATITVPLPG